MELYSVAYTYFNHIAEFKAVYHSVEPRIHDTSTQHVLMSPALNRSSALQRFKRGNAIEICNRIMFDFNLRTYLYSWMLIQVFIVGG